MSRLRIVREFAATRWLRPLRTRAAVERRQRRLLGRQLRFLRRRSPYFHGLIPRHDARLEDLPLLDKRLLMERFDDLGTVGVRRDEAMQLALDGERTREFGAGLRGCSVGLSSGTSGERRLFVVSAAERDAWAGAMLARTLPRGRLTGHRVALFLRADNTLYEAVGSRALRFEYFDTFGGREANLARLEAFAPTILVAPPSMLLVIAAAAEAGRLSIRPERVYSVAEVLETRDARRIASALDRDVVHQLYQCTEGFLAHTCERGTLHLNEDTVLVEREDLGGGRFAPIVTDLRRRAQPIVRYRLGDVLRERDTPCPCGSALTAIERIEGRTGDTLLGTGLETGEPVPVFADLVSRALAYADGVAEYRVVQTAADRLTVALAPNDGDVRARVAAELGALFTRMGCRTPALEFVEHVPDEHTKMRRVRRTMEGNDGDATV